ncbi:hypothetical protein DFR29_10958 [Tahibacter aquaticus]|uniref:Uncharacterized protein n=1 Tax=Tahibacter aquaticus TaxID=520092 RepID=A0A4R6YUJ3_9GAMM|nr:hypothetical protein [Tahibacter aquaticus]TDR42002.1 hypothetical protein DFR29_10958 [Tahibacter aquaticus]
MKMKLLSLALLTAGLVGTVSSLHAQDNAPPAARAATVAAPDPAQEINNLVRLFRAGDLAALAQAMTPRSKWEAARAAFEAQRRKPVSEADRARFAEHIQQLTAPDAVDQLMRKIEPELVKARPQMPGMLLMAFGAAHVAVTSPDSDLTDAQRKALQSVLPGMRLWASNTDFLSSASMRHALTLLSDAARRTGITDVEQLKALPLEGVLERAGPMLAAAKEAVRTYGIDLDAVADSLKVDVLALGTDSARVRTTITVFGAPVWAEHELVLIEGHWYGKYALAEIDNLEELDG